MNIPRTTYADSARRVMRFTPLVFPGFAAVGMLGIFFVGLPITMTVRNYVGGNVGIMLAIVSSIPFVVLPLLLPMAVMLRIDRRFGIRCPNCNVSLTMRCLHEKVLITRKCSHCKSTVLLDDEYVSVSPKSRPWVIALLLILLVLGIVIAIALHMIAPKNNLANTQGELIEFGILLIVVLAIGWIHFIVNKIMKRRWELEAASDGSQSQPHNAG